MDEQACSCGHSPAAHGIAPAGECSFCSCLTFVIPLPGEAIPSISVASAAASSGEGYVLIRDVAERLGVPSSALRRAVHKQIVPALKVARHWVIPARELDVVQTYFATRTPSQRAQATASRDMTARMSHRGRSVSDPVLGRQIPTTAASRAEAETVAHQVDPTAIDHRAPLGRSSDEKTQVAQSAEQEALENILKPSAPTAPERSM
ncbi:MAG: helix-turn-helix domain-containing protein [Chloroflexota bacterium]|nr:helix-turn-helix domain-containing protein [Chloroflexota bacterium]